MQIAIYGRQFGNHFVPYADKLFSRLRKNNVKVSMYEPFYRFIRENTQLEPNPYKLFNSSSDIESGTGFVFSIGGDGTMLETITIVRDSGIPVLGINSGRLGFLANISSETIDMAVDAILSGKYGIEKRSLLELISPGNIFGDFNFALNEFTLQKKDTAMISVHAWLDNDFVNTYWADGLIISTPTGSTAYSLSVGGPLLATGIEGFIISPIAPHNLTVRPIVIPDTKTIRLNVKSMNGEFLLSMDSKSAIISADIDIILKRSAFDITMVRLEHQDFYTTLRSKLMWGADKRN
jgi:NAD+ kinase